MAFLKPQSPLAKGNDYFYPLTTADQVIMDGGYRLDQIVGKVEKSIVTLYQNGWSTAAPYSYSIVVKGLADDLNMKVFPHYSDDFAEKQVLKEEFAKVSFYSRQGNIVTFECWDEIPNIDISIDIEVNILYPLEAAVDMDQLESQLPKLNYSIVGSITEPTNPIENMIWVNTDVAITSHIISKNEPKNPIEGMVWIYLSNNSNVSFYTLNINGKEFDEVYPLSVSQYIDGTWVDKTAKSHQGGSWVDWIVYLYNAGNEFTDFTGGWESFSSVYVYDAGIGYGGGNPPTVTRNADYLKITAKNCSGLVHTRNKIDLTSVKAIKMVGSILPYNQHETTGIYIMTDLIQGYKNKGVARCLPGTVGQTTTGEFTVDVSGLSGKYYVCLAAGSYNNAQNAAEVILEKMWLE